MSIFLLFVALLNAGTLLFDMFKHFLTDAEYTNTLIALWGSLILGKLYHDNH